jgi:hypothetical protein
MNLRNIERLYMGILLVIFAGIVIHAPLTVWLGTLAPTWELVIKSWKEILMLIAVPLAVILVSKKKLWGEFSRDWLFCAVIGFALLHILTLIFMWNGVNPTLAGLSIDLRWLLYFSLVYALIQIQPNYRTLFVKVGVVGALVVGIFALLQVTVLPKDILAHIGYEKNVTIAPYLTVDENENYVRINSTLRGPNPLGAYAVIVLSILFAYVAAKRRQTNMWVSGILGATSLIALWFSYSRSALLAALVAAVTIGYFTLGKRLSKTAWIAGLGTIGVLVGMIAVLWQTQFVQQVILHEDPHDSNMVNSNDGHRESLEEGVKLLAQQPLGAGVGSTGSASLYGDHGFIIENQYLFIAHEAGWLGLLLFLTLFVLVMQRLWVKRDDWLALGVFASGVGLALIGLLLPIWVDDTVAIIWWGLMAVVLGGNDGKKRTRN